MCRCVACNKKIDVVELRDDDGNFLGFEDFCNSCKIASRMWESERSARRYENIIPDPEKNFTKKHYVGNQAVSDNWLV